MLFTKGKRLSATAASVVVCLISEVDLIENANSAKDLHLRLRLRFTFCFTHDEIGMFMEI